LGYDVLEGLLTDISEKDMRQARALILTAKPANIASKAPAVPIIGISGTTKNEVALIATTS
jgi:hypothetical protein